MLAVIACCVVLVVVVQEARQFFIVQFQQPAATPVVVATSTPTSRNEPKSSSQTTALQSSTATVADKSTPALQTPTKPVNLSGKWVGSFSETVDGIVYQYNYILELSQQGTLVAGKSSIEKVDDPNTFAKFVLRGQIARNSNPLTIKITEDLLSAKNLGDSSAAAPRNTQLSYLLAQNQEYLEGEWVDERYSAQNVSGTVKLTKQP